MDAKLPADLPPNELMLWSVDSDKPRAPFLSGRIEGVHVALFARKNMQGERFFSLAGDRVRDGDLQDGDVADRFPDRGTARGRIRDDGSWGLEIAFKRADGSVRHVRSTFVGLVGLAMGGLTPMSADQEKAFEKRANSLPNPAKSIDRMHKLNAGIKEAMRMVELIEAENKEKIRAQHEKFQKSAARTASAIKGVLTRKKNAATKLAVRPN